MGNQLPLPTRIPYNENVMEKMKKDGFDIIGNSEFVEYKMPSGWSLIDKSERRDIPKWYFCDENGMSRYEIYGVWKETYDNEIKICRVSEPKKIERKDTLPLPCETSTIKLLSQLAESMQNLN